MRKKLKTWIWPVVFALMLLGCLKLGAFHQRQSDAYIQIQLDEALGAMSDYKTIADDAQNGLAQQITLSAQMDNRLAFMTLTNDKLTAENGSLKTAVNEALNSGTTTFTATAYTLRSSIDGITATGLDLNGKDVSARIIAVDPAVIPLHSSIYIAFPAPYEDMSDWYQAEDTGPAITGMRVDIYFGGRDEETYQAAMQFGVREVQVICVIPPTS